MLMECDPCGAPLDMGAPTTKINCRYCGAVADTSLLRLLAERAPANWHPRARNLLC